MGKHLRSKIRGLEADLEDEKEKERVGIDSLAKTTDELMARSATLELVRSRREEVEELVLHATDEVRRGAMRLQEEARKIEEEEAALHAARQARIDAESAID